MISSATGQFRRMEQLLGGPAMERLHGAQITVVGLGAVGGHVVEGLVRAGVGQLRLVDFDILQPSNLNRQLLALADTIGRPKAEVARERVLAINPECRVEALQLFAGADTLDQLLTPSPDLLIDAIDALNPKVQLLHGAYTRGVKTLSSMGAALRTDPAQIRTGDLFDSQGCPLAKRVRKFLRRQQVGRGIHCVYSTEPVRFVYDAPEERDTALPFAGRGRPRCSLGSLPTLTGIFGLILANLAILHVAGVRELDGA